MTLDIFSGSTWNAKSISEKIRFFRDDEYFTQFYDDVVNAAKVVYRRAPQYPLENLVLEIYENAIAYAQYVLNSAIPELALETVISEVASRYYAYGSISSNSIAPHDFIIFEFKSNYEIVSHATDIGVVLESMCAVLCFDYMKQKDDRVIDALYNMRQWVFHRSGKGFPVYPHWHFWDLLAERIPDNRYPSEGELRQRIKKLEEEKKQLEQEVLLKLENIAADETEEERDDEEVAEGRFPHRITVGYLLSLMGIKSKENIKNQAALKRALQGLTGVSPTSVNNYLEDFNLALRNNQSELDRLNKELRDAGLPEFHIELDSE